MPPLPIVHIKNLPIQHNKEQLIELLSQFGEIHQLRLSNTPQTQGQLFVIYTTLKAANLAVDKLSGYNYNNRYLVVKLYNPPTHLLN